MPLEVNPNAGTPSGGPTLVEYACRSEDWRRAERTFTLFADRIVVRSKYAVHPEACVVAIPLADLRRRPDRRSWKQVIGRDVRGSLAFGVALSTVGGVIAACSGLPLPGLGGRLACASGWIAGGLIVGRLGTAVAGALAKRAEMESASFFHHDGREAFTLVAARSGDPRLQAFVARLQAQMQLAEDLPTPPAPPVEPLIAQYEGEDYNRDLEELGFLHQSHRLYADRLEIETRLGTETADRVHRSVAIADLGPLRQGPAVAGASTNEPLPPAWIRVGRLIGACFLIYLFSLLLILSYGPVPWEMTAVFAAATLVGLGIVASLRFVHLRSRRAEAKLLRSSPETLPAGWESVLFDVHGQPKPLILWMGIPREPSEAFIAALRKRIEAHPLEGEDPLAERSAAAPPPASPVAAEPAGSIRTPRPSRRADDDGPPQARLAFHGGELRLYADRVEESWSWTHDDERCLAIVELERLSPQAEASWIPTKPCDDRATRRTLAAAAAYYVALCAATWNVQEPSTLVLLLFYAAAFGGIFGGFMLQARLTRPNVLLIPPALLFKVDDGGPGRDVFARFGAFGAIEQYGLLIERPESRAAEVDAFAEAVSKQIAIVRGSPQSGSVDSNDAA